MRSRLKIAEPCAQDWNNMSSLDKNKFCKKCNKEVIDFTTYQKDEILKVLNREQKVCGRLDHYQLTQNYLSNAKTKFSFPKLAILLSIGSILGSSAPVRAKTMETKTEIRELDKWQSILPENKPTDSITIEGVVLDIDNLEIPGVNIILKGTRIATQTDLDGKFSIKVPINELNEKNLLEFTFIGFETQEYRIYRETRYLKVKMFEDDTVLGGVVLVQRQNTFRKIGNFFRNLFSAKY